jgi:hypothetical protein
MIKDLLERFKRVFTVKEWKQEAQDAMAKKEFVIASLNELHRVEKSETASGQERAMSRQPQGQPVRQGPQPMPVGTRRPQPAGGINYDRENEKRKSEMSLAELMNSIRQQQVSG